MATKNDVFENQRIFNENAKEFFMDDEFLSIHSNSNKLQGSYRGSFAMSMRAISILTAFYCHDIILPSVIEELSFNKMYSNVNNLISIKAEEKEIKMGNLSHFKNLYVYEHYMKNVCTDPLVSYVFRYLHLSSSVIQTILNEKSEVSFLNDSKPSDLYITDRDADLHLFDNIYINPEATEFLFFKYLIHNAYEFITPGTAFSQSKLIGWVSTYIRAIPNQRLIFFENHKKSEVDSAIAEKFNLIFEAFREEFKEQSERNKKLVETTGSCPPTIGDIWMVFSTILDGRTYYTRAIAKNNFTKIVNVIKHKDIYGKYSSKLVSKAITLYNVIDETNEVIIKTDSYIVKFSTFENSKLQSSADEEIRVFGSSQLQNTNNLLQETENFSETVNESKNNENENIETQTIIEENSIKTETITQELKNNFYDSDDEDVQISNISKENENYAPEEKEKTQEGEKIEETNEKNESPEEKEISDEDDFSRDIDIPMQKTENILEESQNSENGYPELDNINGGEEGELEEENANDELGSFQSAGNDVYIPGRPYIKTLPLTPLIMEKILSILSEISKRWLDVVYVSDITDSDKLINDKQHSITHSYKENQLFLASNLTSWLVYFATFPIDLAPFMVTENVQKKAYLLFEDWKRTYNEVKLQKENRIKNGMEDQEIYDEEEDVQFEEMQDFPTKKSSKKRKENDEGPIDNIDETESEDEDDDEDDDVTLGGFIVDNE